MKNAALLSAGIVFTLVSLLHWLRYFHALKITITGYTVSIETSMIIGVVTLILGLWMFVAAKN